MKTTYYAEIAFNAIVGARSAQHTLIDIKDSLENILGEKAPVVEKMENAIRELDDSSDLLYALGYNATDYIKPDGPDPKWFIEWLEGKYADDNQ